MAALENLRRQASRLGVSLSTEECCDKLSEDVPSTYSFTDLLGLAETVKPELDSRSTLIAIAACIQHIDRLQTDADDASTARQLASWIARSIAPTNKPERPQDEDTSFLAGYGGTTEDDPYDEVTKRCLSVANTGLTALTRLWEHSAKTQSDILDDDGLVTLIALSDTSESWTTPTTARLASNLLAEQLSTLRLTDFLEETILRGYLRKRFSKSRPAAVTASGRKAEFPADDLDRRQGLPDDSRRTKPWKYEDLRSIPVLAWAIAQADPVYINWPLYIPPLLTLLDDPLTRIRSRGLRLTTSFLTAFPAAKLRSTGLAPLFHDAIFPALSCLPSLTPEDESVAILGPAFEALLALASKLAEAEPTGEHGSSGSTGGGEARKLLDRTLRDGVVAAHAHVWPAHPRVEAVLLHAAGQLVRDLGLAAVRHLRDLVPVLAQVVGDPFALGAAPGTVREGVGLLEAVVENCWPRLEGGVWADEVLGVGVVGWVQLLDWDREQGGEKGDRQEEDVQRVREGLRRTAAMLGAVARAGGVDMAERVAPLVAREPALAELFGVSDGSEAQRSEPR